MSVEQNAKPVIDEVMRGWVGAIRSVDEGRMPVEDILMLSETPSKIVDVIPGCTNLPVFHDAHHLVKEIDDGPKGHKIPEAVLANIPNLLSDPIGAWRSNTKPDTRFMVLIDEVDSENNPLCPVIDTSGLANYRKSRVPCNYVVTICGRGGLAAIVNSAIASESLLYMDVDRLRGLCLRCGLPMPAELSGRSGVYKAPGNVLLQCGPVSPSVIRRSSAEPVVTLSETGLGITVDGVCVRLSPAVISELGFRARQAAAKSVKGWFYEHRFDGIHGDVDAFIARAAAQVLDGTDYGGDIDASVDSVVRRMLSEQDREFHD